MITLEQHMQSLAKEMILNEHNDGKDFNLEARLDPTKYLVQFAIDPRPFEAFKKGNSSRFHASTKKNMGEWISYMNENISSYFDYLANCHWEYLKKNGIIERLNELIEDTKKPTYLEEIANNNRATKNKQVLFLKSLGKNKASLLKDLVTARPEHLSKLIKYISKTIGEEYFINKELSAINGAGATNGASTNAIATQKKPSGKTKFSATLLERIFTYDNYRQSKQLLHTLINLGFKIARCPYCNLTLLQVTQTDINDDSPETAYLQLDHFFSKHRYPFLALSFYNLIPSCSNCNTMDKGAKEFTLDTHINPYTKSANEIYTFTFSTDDLLHHKVSRSSISFTQNHKKDMTFEVFKILTKHINLESIDEVHQIILDNTDLIINGDDKSIEQIVKLLKGHAPQAAGNILRKEGGKLLRDMILQHNYPEYLKIKERFQ